MADPKSWNIWHGCRKYSEGCENCYMFFLDSIHNVPEKSERIERTSDVNKPLRKDQKGRYKVPPGFTLTMNMTSDTFIEEADQWRDEMWATIRKRPDVIFQLLTKRVSRIAGCLPDDWGDGYENVMLSITTENQARFDERWPIFESIPAKHKGLNLAPLLGPIDITPALASGQMEQILLSGESFGGRRPCRHEWIEDISDQCGRFGVNFAVNIIGSVYIKDGVEYNTGNQASQTRWAFECGLSRFYGKPEYRLFSPVDGHLLSSSELYTPTYNKDRCFRCPNINVCPGCVDCGSCRNVVLVDIDGKPVQKKDKPSVKKLEDFF